MKKITEEQIEDLKEIIIKLKNAGYNELGSQLQVVIKKIESINE